MFFVAVFILICWVSRRTLRRRKAKQEEKPSGFMGEFPQQSGNSPQREELSEDVTSLEKDEDGQRSGMDSKLHVAELGAQPGERWWGRAELP